MVSCGISTSFPVLFPTERKVAHALLTRPPLEQSPKQLSPLDLHVLGTPPAFVLSQDQTLAFNPFYLYRCLHRQDANSFGITVSCLRYSCSVSFSRFSAVLLRCPARVSLFILSPIKRKVNTFLQLFRFFTLLFCFANVLPKRKTDRSGVWAVFCDLQIPIIRLLGERFSSQLRREASPMRPLCWRKAPPPGAQGRCGRTHR